MVQIIAYAVGTAGLAVVGVFLVVTWQANSDWPLLPMRRESFRDLPKSHVIAYALAVIAVLTVFGFGIQRILDWIPYSWGGRDEDGEFQPFRDGLVFMMTIAAAIGFFAICAHRVADNVRLRASGIRIRYLAKQRLFWDVKAMLEVEIEKLETFLDDVRKTGKTDQTGFDRDGWEDDRLGTLNATYREILWEMKQRLELLEERGLDEPEKKQRRIMKELTEIRRQAGMDK